MKRFFMLFIFSLLALSGTNASYKSVSSDEAMRMMKDSKDYIILDVRTKGEFDSGHIKGAINIPNETIGENTIKELPNKDQLIFVYCRSGNRSKQASSKLSKLGYTSIIEFGGINSLKGEII